MKYLKWAHCPLMNVRTFWKGAAARISNWKVTASHPVCPLEMQGCLSKGRQHCTSVQCFPNSSACQCVSTVRISARNFITKHITGSLRKIMKIVLHVIWRYELPTGYLLCRFLADCSLGTVCPGDWKQIRVLKDLSFIVMVCYLYDFISLSICFFIYVTLLLVTQWFCMSEIKFHDSPFIWLKGTNNIRVLDFYVT